MTRDVLPESCALPAHAERMQAVETAAEDPMLTTREKELSLTAAKDNDYVTIYSEIGSVTRGLLAHKHVGIEELRVSDDDRFGERLSWEAWKADGGPITGVKAYAPVGLLKIPAKPRSDNFFNRVVSDHDPDASGGSQ